VKTDSGGQSDTATAPSYTNGVCPVAPGDRIDSIDVLRGFAVLGIFVMNIQCFAMFGTVYSNPTYYGMIDGAGYWVWYFSHLFADQKFMTIFSLLFGAGIVLFASSKEDAGQPPRRYHYRRSGWLILFGLIHAYLIWAGDILFLYGVCALWVYPFRKARPSRLIVAGLVVLAIGFGISMVFGATAPMWSEEQQQGFVEGSWQPPPDKLALESRAYTGSYVEQVRYRAPVALMWQTVTLLIWGVWRAGGLMLIGMAFCKLGVFGARRSGRFYTMLVLSGVVGLAVVAFGINQFQSHDWDPFYSFFIGTQYNYWGSLLVSGSYIGGVLLICKSEKLRGVTRPFAAAGRMAFSNYIGQSLIAAFIFYGPGLGYFNQIDRVGQMLIVASVWVLQLIVSSLWLKRFRFGPLEWLWRSLTYGVRQPFRI
jgi:uncharacterized protein